jgi:hypothetical protein
LHHLPGHVKATRAVIPAGQNQATLQVTADAKAARIDRPDVFAQGTATAASNKHVRSGPVTVSVHPKTAVKPPRTNPVKKPKTMPKAMPKQPTPPVKKTP